MTLEKRLLFEVSIRLLSPDIQQALGIWKTSQTWEHKFRSYQYMNDP